MAVLLYSLLALQVTVWNFLAISSQNTCPFGTTSLSATTLDQIITSPNYPSNYPARSRCFWKITAPPGNYVVTLQFTVFNMEYYLSTSCIRAHLKIYYKSPNGSVTLGEYCGRTLPPKVHSPGRDLYLDFESSIIGKNGQFMITYKAVKKEPNAGTCSPFNTVYDNNNIKLSSRSGIITSPLYPDKYPSNMECNWVITAPYGETIKLTFQDNKMSFSNCYYGDKLEVSDGAYAYNTTINWSCGKCCGFQSAMASTGRYMHVTFKSNSDNDVSHGFKAKWEVVKKVSTTRSTILFHTFKVNTYMYLTESSWNSSGSRQGNLGMILGITFGVIALVGIIVGAVCLVKRCNSSGHGNQPPSSGYAMQTVTQHSQPNTGVVYQPPAQMPSSCGYPPPVGVGYGPPISGGCATGPGDAFSKSDPPPVYPGVQPLGAPYPPGQPSAAPYPPGQPMPVTPSAPTF